MWTIAASIAYGLGYGFVPTTALPFGMLAVGAGLTLARYLARYTTRYDYVRTYEKETTP